MWIELSEYFNHEGALHFLGPFMINTDDIIYIETYQAWPERNDVQGHKMGFKICLNDKDSTTYIILKDDYLKLKEILFKKNEETIISG